METLNNINVEYVYHTHEDANGNTCDLETNNTLGGCFTVPIYHVHSGSCYEICNGTLSDLHQVSLQGGTITWTVRTCNSCGQMYNLNTPASARCTARTSTLICGKSGSSIDSYGPSCGFTNGDLEQAVIDFSK